MPAPERQNTSAGFILTAVSQDADMPCVWGFEVFTSEWRQLARFTYNSEKDAVRAAHNFAWMMERMAAVGVIAGPGRDRHLTARALLQSALSSISTRRVRM